MEKKQKTKTYIFIFLFLIAFLERTVFDLGPNVELLTTVMVLASYFLAGDKAFWLTFLVISISDRFIGNSKIFLFTWAGFLIPAIILPKISKAFKNSKLNGKNLAIKTTFLTGTAVTANLFFYFFTNFGVWLLDTWGMYSKDIYGLILCYINGLPFLKNQVLSSLIFIPLVYLSTEFVLKHNFKFVLMLQRLQKLKSKSI